MLKSIIIATFFMLSINKGFAQGKDLVIRVAKLVIDSTQLENYKSLLKEGMETAVRTEPGVITLYAVYEKEHPNRVMVFEIYKNVDAYQSHVHSAHFLKYKTGTRDMVKSLELVDVAPIALESKARLPLE